MDFSLFFFCPFFLCDIRQQVFRLVFHYVLPTNQKKLFLLEANFLEKVWFRKYKIKWPVHFVNSLLFLRFGVWFKTVGKIITVACVSASIGTVILVSIWILPVGLISIIFGE